MALDDEELDKLCLGRIVIAKVYGTLNDSVTKERPAIVISSNEQLRKSNRFRVVAISHNEHIDPTYIMPAPAYSGFDGYIIGSFAPMIEEGDVRKICGMLVGPDLARALLLVRQADDAKKKAADVTSKPSPRQ